MTTLLYNDRGRCEGHTKVWNWSVVCFHIWLGGKGQAGTKAHKKTQAHSYNIYTNNVHKLTFIAFTTFTF